MLFFGYYTFDEMKVKKVLFGNSFSCNGFVDSISKGKIMRLRDLPWALIHFWFCNLWDHMTQNFIHLCHNNSTTKLWSSDSHSLTSLQFWHLQENGF